MLKKYRIISIVICISMIFCLIVSTSALGATQVFSGKIVCEDNIDLSDVEIKIYYSERTYDEEGNFLYYVETYERSVYADADGDFEFVKPSLYCSYTINVETLPANYGVSKHTQFIIPTRTNDSVALSAIATAEADYNGGSFYAVFRAVDGTEIYTDYDIVEDSESSVFVASENLSTTKQIISSENIEDVNSYTLSGTIVTKGRNYRYSKNFDISDYSEIEKADLLCSLGKITKEEKYNIYSQNDELLYEHNCIQFINDESRAVNEDAIEYDSTCDIDFGSYTMQIRYNANDFTNHVSNFNLFKTQLTNIYRYFCQTNGFIAPTTTGNYFYLYLTTIDQALGLTTSYVGGTSYIMIDRTIVQNGTAERTLAHEFMHAIMCKYLTYTADLWFNESFATMAALVYMYEENHSTLISYSGFTPFRNYLVDYISTPYRPLIATVGLHEYGALIFPLCIYDKHGRWPTIKTIFLNFHSASSEFDAIQGQSFNFSTIYTEMAVAILFPRDQPFGFLIARDYELEERWPDVSCSTRNIPSSMTNNTISLLSSHYFSYSSSSNIGTVYITATSTGDCLFNMFKWTSATTFTQVCSNEPRVVFQIDNFGSPYLANKIFLIVSNLSTSNQRNFSISTQQ